MVVGLVSVILLTLFAGPTALFAASSSGLQDATKQLQEAGDAPYGAKSLAGDPRTMLVFTVGSIIQGFLELMGVAFLAPLIYGGYMWMTARGETDKVTKAKGIIIDAVIGLVIVFGAYVISQFIVSRIIAAAVVT